MPELKDEMKEQMQALTDHTNQQLKEQIREAKGHFITELEILKTNKQKSLK